MRGTDIIRRRARDVIASAGLADRLALREVVSGSKHFRVVVERRCDGALTILTISHNPAAKFDWPKTVNQLKRHAR